MMAKCSDGSSTQNCKKGHVSQNLAFIFTAGINFT